TTVQHLRERLGALPAVDVDHEDATAFAGQYREVRRVLARPERQRPGLVHPFRVLPPGRDRLLTAARVVGTVCPLDDQAAPDQVESLLLEAIQAHSPSPSVVSPPFRRRSS